MSAAHTPGPWASLPEEVDKPYIRIRGTRLGGRYKVANVITPVYDGVHEREAIETRANARLIAAAPELLEALLIAKDTIPHIGGNASSVHSLIKTIEQAITKATGGQQ